MMNIDEIINRAADVAVKKYIESQKEEFKKNNFHNTELLLKNYNGFVEHYKNAKDSIADIEEDIERKDIDDDEIYIKSIRKSKFRTMIMIAHMEASISKLHAKMESKGQVEKIKIIQEVYFNGKSFIEIAKELSCSEASARRWKNEMIRELSVLLFGLDGLRMDV